MLTKLLKYEFRATARTFGICYAALLAVAALFAILLNVSNWNGDNSLPLNWLAVILIVAYVALLCIVGVLTLVMLIQRFEKNLLGGEGYLMNTLPVSPWQHITSKLIVSLAWCVCSVAASVLSFAILAMVEVNLDDLFGSLGEILRQIDISSLWLPLFIVLVGIVEFILQVYASMMLGQCFNKGKKFLAVVFFVVFLIIMSIVDSNTWGNLTMYSVSTATEAVTLVKELIFSAAFFALTDYLLKRRLNLE